MEEKKKNLRGRIFPLNGLRTVDLKAKNQL